VVEALHALRGVQFTVAIPLVAALGDLTRLHHPSALMHSLGLPPAESSRGERRRHGALTTSGNTPARRVLVAGAWASRYPAKVRRQVHLRLEKQPTVRQDLRWKAHVRFGQRSRQLIARGKHAQQVVGAMAREWGGCIGAMATHVRGTPSRVMIGHMQAVTGDSRHVDGKSRRPGVVDPSTA